MVENFGAQELQQIAADPRSQMPAMGEDGKPMMQNAVAQLDVDIILDEAPDTVTVQSEEFGKLADLDG